jgi:hypothetical protein
VIPLLVAGQACSKDEAVDSNPDFTVGGSLVAGQAGSAALAGSVPGGSSGTETPPYDCVLHPVTHIEIINACTDSVRIEKDPDVPAPGP